MLSSISWQEFLFTAGMLVAVYYVCTTLFFYHQDIIRFLKGKQRSEEHTHTTLPAVHPVIGPVRFSDAPSEVLPNEVSTQELTLATQEPEDAMTVVDPIAEKQQHDLTEILDQIESLSQVTIQTPTIELQALFKTLLANYPGFVGTTHQSNISQAISETLTQHGHAIAQDEIQSWWPT